MEYPTKHIQEVVEGFCKLPGIGKKTALRLVLFLMNKKSEEVQAFAESLYNLHRFARRCEVCHHITEQNLCNICTDTSRNAQALCVVEEIGDLLTLEKTGHYRGKYHVLGGKISPLEGIGPKQLTIEKLLNRLSEEPIEEVILALSTTQEGEATAHYLAREIHLLFPDVHISLLAKGVPAGYAVEYTDEMTLIRSFQNRSSYQPIS